MPRVYLLGFLLFVGCEGSNPSRTSIMTITGLTESVQCVAFPYSARVASVFSVRGQVIVGLQDASVYCRELNSSETSRVSERIVLLHLQQRGNCLEEVRFNQLRVAGAHGVVVVDDVKIPGRTAVRYPQIPDNVLISNYPVIVVGRDCGVTLQSLATNGSKAWIAAAVDASQNEFVTQCASLGRGTLALRVFLPLVTLGIMAFAALRLTHFVRAEGFKLSLNQVVLTATQPICALNLLHLLGDGMSGCRPSAFPVPWNKLLGTITVPLTLSCTLAISLFFWGITRRAPAGARGAKPVPPLRRFRLPLAVLSFLMVAMEVVFASLRAAGSDAMGMQMLGGVYLLTMIFLSAFFASSSFSVLRAVGHKSASSGIRRQQGTTQHRSSASPLEPAPASAAAAGYSRTDRSSSSSSAPTAAGARQRLHMARWLPITALCLLLLVAASVMLATALDERSPGLYFLTHLLFWASRTGIIFTQAAVFLPPTTIEQRQRRRRRRRQREQGKRRGAPVAPATPAAAAARPVEPPPQPLPAPPQPPALPPNHPAHQLQLNLPSPPTVRSGGFWALSRGDRSFHSGRHFFSSAPRLPAPLAAAGGGGGGSSFAGDDEASWGGVVSGGGGGGERGGATAGAAAETAALIAAPVVPSLCLQSLHRSEFSACDAFSADH